MSSNGDSDGSGSSSSSSNNEGSSSSLSSASSTSSSSPSTSSSSPNVTAFLSKLWRLVDDDAYNDLIRWTQSGCSFIIFNQVRFADELLPLFFKHSNMASFIRQLNMYGFKKLTTNVNNNSNGQHQQQQSGMAKNNGDELCQSNGQRDDAAQFYHCNFIRGQAKRLVAIKRKNNSCKTHHLVVSGTFCDEVKEMLNDVKSIQDRQNSSENIFGSIQLENKTIWREVAVLRSRHHKQQHVMEKLVQFLMSLIDNRHNIVTNKRKMHFMIDGLTGNEFQHFVECSSSASASPTSSSSGSSSTGSPDMTSSASPGSSCGNRSGEQSPQDNNQTQNNRNNTNGNAMKVSTSDKIGAQTKTPQQGQQQQQEFVLAKRARIDRANSITLGNKSLNNNNSNGQVSAYAASIGTHHANSMFALNRSNSLDQQQVPQQMNSGSSKGNVCQLQQQQQSITCNNMNNSNATNTASPAYYTPPVGGSMTDLTNFSLATSGTSQNTTKSSSSLAMRTAANGYITASSENAAYTNNAYGTHNNVTGIGSADHGQETVSSSTQSSSSTSGTSFINHSDQNHNHNQQHQNQHQHQHQHPHPHQHQHQQHQHQQQQYQLPHLNDSHNQGHVGHINSLSATINGLTFQSAGLANSLASTVSSSTSASTSSATTLADFADILTYEPPYRISAVSSSSSSNSNNNNNNHHHNSYPTGGSITRPGSIMIPSLLTGKSTATTKLPSSTSTPISSTSRGNLQPQQHQHQHQQQHQHQHHQRQQQQQQQQSNLGFSTDSAAIDCATFGMANSFLYSPSETMAQLQHHHSRLARHQHGGNQNQDNGGSSMNSLNGPSFESKNDKDNMSISHHQQQQQQSQHYQHQDASITNGNQIFDFNY